MAGAGGRSLEQTPTWAVAIVCFVLVAISIVIEHVIHLIGEVKKIIKLHACNNKNNNYVNLRRFYILVVQIQAQEVVI